jgi:hypothetical protein
VFQHPYISQAVAAERIADWLRTADASRRGRISANTEPTRRRRRSRRSYQAGPVPGQQAGSGTVAGQLGAGSRDGASMHPAELAASRAPGKHSAADRAEEHPGAAAMSQTRC